MRKKLLVRFSVLYTLKCLRVPILAFLLIVLHLRANAQLQLLKDVNTSEDVYFNEYRYLTHAGTHFYYVSRNELWRSNGTKEGTFRLRAFANISNLAMMGSTLYFAADNGSTGLELWRTNGTVTGTVMIRDIYPGTTGSTPNSFTNVNGTIYFSARSATHGVELWKTNGTAAGTVLVKDILTGTGSSNPGQMVNRNGILLFVANDAKIGYELWRSDGTAAGTHVVKDIRTAYRASSLARYLTNINGTVFFSAIDDTGGRELWKTDGTAAGTVRVKDIRPGTIGSDVENLINLNGTLVFTADDGVSGDELWKSNGTSAGTVLLKDLNPGAQGSNNAYPGVDDPAPMSNFTVINGLLYFTAARDYSNFIYRTDGTTAGTIEIAEVGWSDCCGGSLWPYPQFTYLNGDVYFYNFFWDETLYYYTAHLYKMPYNGTTPVKGAGFASNYGGPMLALGNNLFTINRLDPNKGYQLIKSDGTTAGTTVLIDNTYNTNGSDIDEMLTLNGLVYFRARSGNTEEIWRTDGTPQGTIRLGKSARGYPWVAAGNYVYWVTFTDAGFWQIWRSAGAVASTVKILEGSLHDMDNQPPKQMVNVSGRLYVSTKSGKLYRSDGTAAGTRMLADFPIIKNLFAGAGKAFIFAITANQVYELWRADASGAYRVSTLASGVNDLTSAYYPSVTIGGATYFVAFDNIHGNEVWRTDGTAAGTYMVQDLSTADKDNEWWEEEHGIQAMVVHNNSLYVSAWDSERKWWIWKQTGPRTFTKLRQIHGAVTMKSFNGKLYIWALDYLNADGNAVYVTDGTADGFEYLGTFDGEFEKTDLGIVGNVIYFSARRGSRLWRTDGTPCGTFQVSNPGIYFPRVSEGLGTSLIVGSHTPTIGHEPYVYRNINSQNPSPCATTLAIKEPKQKGKPLKTYPNPYTQEFRMRVDGEDDEIVDVAVYSSAGFPIETFKGIKANTDYDHLGTTWAPGIYIVKVLRGSETTTHLLVKK
ncbi:MAG TPA: ELWxxDGT repeat protein [Chryseosolibacter sp.]|nr:ELWxxDGT repeat protein [Chryseosolibacter sp.]